MSRVYAATDDTFLSTNKTYGATASTLELATDSGTATFQATDGFNGLGLNVTLTAASVQLTSQTFVLSGVRFDGVTDTENVTGPAANTMVEGVKAWRSISGITATRGPTGGISVGIGKTMQTGPSRVKAYRVNFTTNDGEVSLYDGNATGNGTKIVTLDTATGGGPSIDSEHLPGNGLRFENSVRVTFTTGVKSVNLFHA